MFGQNEIVGKKYFADQAEGHLMVTSLFVTLQGEGPYSGKPAVFVRLSKCNLACSFCDTFFDNGDVLNVGQITERIELELNKVFDVRRPKWTKHGLFDFETPNLAPYQKDMVLVITGGEPMLQPALPGLLEWGNHAFKHTQIETNGTIVFPSEFPIATTVVCSPKCNEKDGKPTKYLIPRPQILERADCLKFVMCADPESPYSRVPDWALKWRHDTGKPVYCSPMNIYNDVPRESKIRRMNGEPLSIEERSTIDEVISFWTPGLLNLEQNQRNHEYTARYALHHGLQFQVQLHLLAGLA